MKHNRFDDFISRPLFYLAFAAGVAIHGTLALIRKLWGKQR